MKAILILFLWSFMATASVVTITQGGPNCNGITDGYVLTAQSNACTFQSAGGGSAITALTSDVTATGPGSVAATIANNVVTNAKLATIATARFKGRITAGTGNVEDLTGTQATSLLDVMVGDSGSGGTKGLVPAPATGDATKFLTGAGTYAPGGSGDVAGPGSATDSNVAVFDGTTGKLIKNGSLNISGGGIGGQLYFQGSSNMYILSNLNDGSGLSSYILGGTTIKLYPFLATASQGIFLGYPNGTNIPSINPGEIKAPSGTNLQLTADNTVISGGIQAANLSASSSATTGTLCWTTGTGNINVDTTTTCLLSAGKYKEKVDDLDSGLKQVMALRPVSYQLRKEYNPSKLGRQIGFIAEEVEKVEERLVSHDEEGGVHAVRYMQMTALLTKAIQQQQAEINDLRAELTSIKIKELSAEITSFRNQR